MAQTTNARVATAQAAMSGGVRRAELTATFETVRGGAVIPATGWLTHCPLLYLQHSGYQRLSRSHGRL